MFFHLQNSYLVPMYKPRVKFKGHVTLACETSIHYSFFKVIGTWVIEYALLGCTLVPSMKSVCEIASEIWPVL